MSSFYILLLYFVLAIVINGASPASKRYNQEVRKRSNNPKPEVPIELRPDEKQEVEVGINGATDEFETDIVTESCPTCLVKTYLTRYSIHRFWNHDGETAYACACHALKANPNDDLAKALITSLRSARMINKETSNVVPTKDPKQNIKSWEILGPINVGKLELDADPTFHSPILRQHQGDVGSYLLSMDGNAAVYSDLVSEGHIQWQKASAKSSGQVLNTYSDM
jgi:hypothetical protein